MIKADYLLFDLDGTLVDSSGDIAVAANRTLAHFGYDELTYEHIKNCIGWGVVMLLEQIMPGAGEERIEEARRKFLEFYSAHLTVLSTPYPGVVETIDRFHNSGKRMAVVSNKPEALSVRVIDELGLSGRFEFILGGDSVANKKPHPEPIEKALSLLGGSPESSVMVGDSPVDCESARSAGAASVGVTYGFRGAAELKEACFDRLVDDFPSLTGVIG